jgi:prepilin-type N-terminal cleavage/methylation domain-containing protein
MSNFPGLEMASRFKSPFIIFRGAKGFTLIEVMVAITILMLVILPLATLYVRSLTVIQNAALYSQAIQLGQERMEVCQALGYGSFSYYNEIFTPGFPYEEGLPPNYFKDYYGAPMVSVPGNAYDNRDNPDTPVVELYFDPTDSDNEHYPVPVYRDYYNNYTGQCLDPNFDGLCNDDLDGDGGAGDMQDIEIATNGRLLKYTDVYPGTPADNLYGSNYIPGDGLFDTVVEGAYVSSMDPMYRKVRVTESPSMILDFALLMDQQHKAAVSDFRYREATYKNFVRMTTFIDPTPSLGNPNFVGTWIDQLYIRDREVLDGYTFPELAKIYLCLGRDLPVRGGMSSYDVGVDEGGLADLDAFNVNYSVPVYGMRIIVTVFYLTGEGEVQMVDIDGDGVVDEERPIETYGGARRVRLEQMFYNTSDITGGFKDYAPPRKYILSTAGGADNPARSLTLPSVVGTGVDSDPCSLDNKGLPYLQ